MKKDVLIEIKGVYKQEGDEDEIELFTTGSYYKRNGNYYIAYDESEATGFDGTHTVLKVEQSDKVTLLRTGKAISLTDLIDEVPVDAARFLFNLREPNSMVDFDLGLAVEQSMQNPVYYVQYAHARICSLLKKLAEEGVSPRACSQKELSALNTSEEAELIRALARFPQEIVDAARSYDPARLTKYAVDVATLFHKYYTVCRVKGEAEPLMQARLNLCLAARTVIRNVLNLLKITFPESM